MFRVTRIIHQCGIDNKVVGKVVDGGGVSWTMDGGILSPSIARCPYCDDVQSLPTSLDIIFSQHEHAVIAKDQEVLD